MVKKTLGIDLSNMNDDLRKKYKIKDSVKGVVILASMRIRRPPRSGSLLAMSSSRSRRRSPTQRMQAKIDQLKKEGRKSALLLVPVLTANCASWH